MICQGVFDDSKGQNARTTDKDEDENGASGHDTSFYTPSDELATVRDRLHLRERKLELADEPSGVSRSYTKKSDAKQSGDSA